MTDRLMTAYFLIAVSALVFAVTYWRMAEARLTRSRDRRDH
jgi:hypothetical protein